MYGGHYIVKGNQVTMHFSFHSIRIPVDIGRTNLPLVHNSFVTEHQKWTTSPQMRISLAYSILSKLDVFVDLSYV